VSVDRNGQGVPIYTGAEGEKDLSAGKKMATQIRGGSNAGGAIPNGAEMHLRGVEGSTVDIDKFVRYQDEQIARAVLAHFLNLGSQTGSWALGSTFADFFTLSLQSIAEDYRDTATAHVVEDLVDINFGRSEPAPRLYFEEIGKRGDVENSLTQMRRLAGLEDDDDLADFLRQHVGTAQPGNEGNAA
jgi:phage gp29-like protein